MYNFKFADIGEGIHEGKILEIPFKVGDKVKEGESLFLVETDKVNAEIPSPVSGIIKEYKNKVGDIIHVGEVIVVIDDGSTTSEAEPKEEPKEAKKEKVTEGEEEKAAGVIGEIEVSDEIISSVTSVKKKEKPKKALATPVARKLAKDLGIDINEVTGTGPNGRVMKDDIRNHAKPEVKEPSVKTVVTEEDTIIPMSQLRKTIAKAMVDSKTHIPHASSMDNLDVTELVKFRNENKDLFDIKLTFMPFIIKAIATTLKDFKMFNASLSEDGENIIVKNNINIGIATDTQDGLIVPVIKNADKLSIYELAKKLNEIKEKAENKTFTLEDLSGGTFTITNYGAVGSGFGIPVIRYPESAIMGVGRLNKSPVVKDDEIVIRDLMPITVAIDHRIIDGADALRFLNNFNEYISNPMKLLMK